MSQVKVSGNASGTGVFTVAAPNSNSNYTLTLPAATGTAVLDSATQTLTNKTLGSGLVAGASLITSGTAVSASGTAVDFTSIPSWVKRVTVMFNGVSTNGTSLVLVQVGSGSVSTTGYSTYCQSSGAGQSSTAGFVIDTSGNAAYVRSGLLTFDLIASNQWVGGGTVGSVGTFAAACVGYSPALGGALDRVRITTVNGTDTFDAGTINILYE